LVVVVPFKVVILSYVMGSRFLSLLEALLELTFWYHVEWLAMDPEFQRHLENCTIVAMISFLVKRGTHNGPNHVSEEGGLPQPVLAAKDGCTDNAVCTDPLAW